MNVPQWIGRVVRSVEQAVPVDFVGRIEINVFKGGISNVRVEQSFKAEVQTTGK